MPDSETNRRWRHKKRGTTYEEIGRAELQNAWDAPLSDGTTLVIYRGEDGKLWARQAAEFEDGRFEELHTGEVDSEPWEIAWKKLLQDNPLVGLRACMDAAAAAEKERERGDARDAARYRWLVANAVQHTVLSEGGDAEGQFLHFDNTIATEPVEEAIDRLMREGSTEALS